jgi:hypothetical protein
MTIYSNKILKKEFNDTIIKAAKIKPIKQQQLTFKVIRCITPSLGGLVDGVLSKDRSLVMASAFNMLAQNANDALFEELQTTLLGALLDDDDEPLTTPDKINKYLENIGVDDLDLLVWMFEEQLASPIMQSGVFKAAMSHVEQFKQAFNTMLTPELTNDMQDAEGV